MKLTDIINTELSLWNALGKSGGTALPGLDKSVKVNDIDVWKKDPPYRKKHIKEAVGGRGGGQQSITPHYDVAMEPGIEDIGYPEPSTVQRGNYDNWASPPKEDKWYMVKDRDGRTRKVMIRRSGENSQEAMDDEGNHYLLPHTGPIDHKKMHIGHRARPTSDINENRVGTGLGGTGATQQPVSGPSELEYDLDKVWDEFKGKDTRSDIKTNKKKRETLKQYLMKRAGRK